MQNARQPCGQRAQAEGESAQDGHVGSGRIQSRLRRQTAGVARAPQSKSAPSQALKLRQYPPASAIDRLGNRTQTVVVPIL